jgi:hypothetical protein
LLLNFYHQETKLTKQLKEFDDKQLLFLWFKEEGDEELFWLHEHDEDVYKTYKFLYFY